jgi:hypothetical protein
VDVEAFTIGSVLFCTGDVGMFGVDETSTDGDEDVLFGTPKSIFTSVEFCKVGIELELN